MSAPNVSRTASNGDGGVEPRNVPVLRSFLRAPFTVKVMALEAALLLLLARLLVKHVPMRHWRRWLTTADGRAAATEPMAGACEVFVRSGSETPAFPRAGPPRSPPSPPHEASAGAVRRAVSIRRGPGRRLAHRVARIVRGVARRPPPFRAVCLPQAMAAQWMLRRRRMESCLSLGARRKAEDEGLEFHAWLTVAGECLLGGQEVETYTVLPPFDGIASPRRAFAPRWTRTCRPASPSKRRAKERTGRVGRSGSRKGSGD